MPSSRPIANSGCGVGPLYSRTRAIGVSPSQAIAQRVRANSRSSRSQMAYAAYSRSRSRKVRSSALSTVARATTAPRRPTATVAISRLRPARRRSVGRRPRGDAGAGSWRTARKPGVAAQRAAAASVAARSPASNGGRMTPSSVTIPVISSAGVTSNAGFRTSVPGGAIRTPRNSRTSSGRRSSIGMAEPSAVARSTELVGAQT